jgi:hypothetical protein
MVTPKTVGATLVVALFFGGNHKGYPYPYMSLFIGVTTRVAPTKILTDIRNSLISFL